MGHEMYNASERDIDFRFHTTEKGYRLLPMSVGKQKSNIQPPTLCFAPNDQGKTPAIAR